jgi:hypothetical protein
VTSQTSPRLCRMRRNCALIETLRERAAPVIVGPRSGQHLAALIIAWPSVDPAVDRGSSKAKAVEGLIDVVQAYLR